MTNPLETVAEALARLEANPTLNGISAHLRVEAERDGEQPPMLMISKALSTLRAYMDEEAQKNLQNRHKCMDAPKPEEVQDAIAFLQLRSVEISKMDDSEDSNLKTIHAALEAFGGWRTIETCPKAHGVDYRLWDADDFTEVVTWFGDGEWCREGRYTHWQPIRPPAAPKETT